MRTTLTSFFIIMVFLTFGAVTLLAQQTSGQITGTIFDSQGAVLPGVEVTVTDPNTAFSRRTVSTAAGVYTLPALPPGSYDMSVKAKGFAALEQKGISLVVGQVLTLNQTLKPGATSEVVEVTSEPPLVETSKTRSAGQ
jgi:hypothetical protein